MPQEYLTEAETPDPGRTRKCNSEAFPKEEKATREKQGLQTDLHGTKVLRDQGIILRD